jgi:acyl-CoA synthetase (AMP-forming)/AMP-acid ligase II
LERSTTFEDLVEERSVHDVFALAAVRQPDAVALTMLMTGAADEEPRKVTYADLVGLVNRAGNAFAALADARPGVAYMLPSLVETHAVLWGAQSAGFAVPLNFLLNPEHLADLVRAADADILVTLGPHPTLDLWQKARAMAAAVGQPDAYAGELPVVYLALRPDASASVEDLHEHARATIAERPAWPREIYVLDALPMTPVGKLFKPDLRIDAARRMVESLLAERMGARLGAPPPVDVSLGGTHGMRVIVTVPDDELASEIEPLLSAHLFEAAVVVTPTVATDAPT